VVPPYPQTDVATPGWTILYPEVDVVPSRPTSWELPPAVSSVVTPPVAAASNLPGSGWSLIAPAIAAFAATPRIEELIEAPGVPGHPFSMPGSITHPDVRVDDPIHQAAGEVIGDKGSAQPTIGDAPHAADDAMSAAWWNVVDWWKGIRNWWVNRQTRAASTAVDYESELKVEASLLDSADPSRQLEAVRLVAELPPETRDADLTARAWEWLDNIVRQPPQDGFSLSFKEFVRLKTKLYRLSPEYQATFDELLARRNLSVVVKGNRVDIGDIVAETPPRIWKHIYSIFRERGRVARLKEYGIEPTPYNLLLFKMGRSVKGQKIALDLDGMLLDSVTEETSVPGEYRLDVRIEPGAEALVLGLDRSNTLLLCAGRKPAQVAKILDHSPAFKKAFRYPFAFVTWVGNKIATVSKALDRPEELTISDKKALELFKAQPPLVDIVIDGSPVFENLFNFSGGATRQIHIRLQKPDGPKHAADDRLLQVVRLLGSPDKFQSARIEHADPLPDEPVRQFSFATRDAVHLLELLESLLQRWLARNPKPSN
ncbi:MAG: hypothetical protein V2A66_06055, partial [Pseudomonadota bacterium]